MELEVGKAWGRALRLNTFLIHLDLSYNTFGDIACRQIGKKLRKNHTLFGLHMAGNACEVDTHGFLVFDGLPEPPAQQDLKKSLDIRSPKAVTKPVTRDT